MHRTYAIISAARSGSTYLAEWLFGYLHEHRGYRRALMEYFTVNPARIRWNYVNRDIVESAKAPQSTVTQRLQWLQDSPYRYLVKHRSDHVTNKVYFSKCHVIIPYRENVLQQVLSYGLSRHMQTWYSSSPVNWKNLRLTYPRSTFDAIAREIATTVTLAKTLPKVTLLSYDEFVREPMIVLDKLNLPRKGFRNVPKSVKMNHHHESNFVNLKDVRTWCGELNDAAHRFR